MKARLLEIVALADQTIGFVFEIDAAQFRFTPGQCCTISVQHPRYRDHNGSMRSFSIASSPADLPHILFATRLTGSAFERSLIDAGTGAEVEVDGPFGSFTLPQNTDTSAVFFAGGIGITPFRSMIKDATEQARPHHFLLFYSNQTGGGAAFLSDLERWTQKNPRFRFIVTVTEPMRTPMIATGCAIREFLNPDLFTMWPYETGAFDAAFLRQYLQKTDQTVFYIAGPEPFITGVREALRTLGIDPNDVRSEEFPGY